MRWIRRIAIALVALLLVLAGLLAATLGTEAGRRMLANFAGSTASKFAGLDIRIEDLRPFGFWSMEVGRVTVAAKGQPIATVETIHVGWSWSDLRRLDFRPRTLTVAQVDLQGLPPDDGMSKSGGGLPSLAPPLLPVQSLIVDDIIVAPSVMGEALRLSLTAMETVASPGQWTLDLDLNRLDRSGDTVRLTIGYGSSTDALRVEAVVAEAPGGIIGRHLGTETGRVDLHLAGEGPASAWKGRLTAQAEGVADIDAALTLTVGEGVAAGIDGTARLAKVAPDPGTIRYRANLRWPAGNRVEIAKADIDTALGAVSLQGRIDGPVADLSGTARMEELSVFDPTLSGRATVAFQTRGAMDDLRVTADLAGAPALKDGVSIGTLTAKAELRLRPADIEVALTGTASAIGGLPAEAAPMLGDTASFSLQVRGDPAKAVTVERLALGAGQVSLEGRADLLPAGGTSTADLKLSVRDLAALEPVAGMELKGRVVADFRIRGDLATRGFHLEGDAMASDFAIAEPRLAALLGRAPRIEIAGTGDAGGMIHLEAFTATLAGGSVRTTGSIDTAARTLSLATGAEVKDVAGLAPDIARGALRLDARLSGPFDRLALAGQVELRGATLSGLELPRGTAGFDIANLTGDATGKVQADLGFTIGRVTLSSDLAFTDRRLLSARRFTLNGPGIVISGDIRFDTIQTLAEGTIDLKAVSLRPAARLAGLDLDGKLEGNLRLERAGNRQRLVTRMEANALRLDDITLSRLSLRGTIDDAFGAPGLKADLDAADLAKGDNKIPLVRAAAEGTPKTLRFTADAAGTIGRPFQLALAGMGGMEGADWRLGIDRLNGRLAEVPITLRRPLTASGDANGVILAPVEIAVDRGSIIAEGRLQGERIAATLRLDGFPAALAQIVKPDLKPEGRIGADLRLSGSLAAVEGVLTLRADGLRATPDLPRISSEIRANLGGRRLTVDGQMTGMGDAPLVLKADLPLTLQLRPFAMEAPPSGPVSATLSGPVNLRRVLALVLPVDDQITGTAMIQAALAGTVAAPQASGSITLAGGRYVNVASEAVVTDLALAITAQGQNLTLQGSGGDGSGGTLALNGRIALDPKAKFPLSATLSMRDFRAARRDDALARLTADLSLGPDLGAPKLAGEIRVVEAELRIPERLPPNVVALNVREINRPGVKDDEAAAKPTSLLVIGLDLKIAAPNRVFVRGRGLDAEFGGAFTVRGTSREPQILGDLKVVRGNIDLLGKRLTVESGSIVFPGGARINPDIAAVATFGAGTGTGEVTLSGTLSSPTIKLGSRSGLPQDEVLSRLLFGTGTASLTPFQAIQLAQSAATLVSGSTSGGPLEQLRRRAGLDRLDVQGGTGATGPSVEVGKYLAPNILLKAQQGTGSAGPSVGVEVEVTPNISVDTRVGADAKSSIGVNLKKDY